MLHNDIAQNDFLGNDSPDKNYTAPRLYELAAVCQDVYYEPNDPKRPRLKNGWKLLDRTTSINGYAGACYIKESVNPPQVVFAHRGTVFSIANIPSITAGLEAGLGLIPHQMDTAVSFVKEVIKEKVEKKYEEYILTMTGHSLGAVLADLTKLKIGGPGQVFTFDSPGSKPSIEKWMINEKFTEYMMEMYWDLIKYNHHVYNTGPNFINTCNQQVGEVYTINMGAIYRPEHIEVPPYPPKSRYFLNPYYILTYTFKDQHLIKRICDFLQWDQADLDWSMIEGPQSPSNTNFQLGYAKYLDMDAGESREDYWCNYAGRVWDHREDIRLKYNGWDFASFYKDFKEEIRKTHVVAAASGLNQLGVNEGLKMAAEASDLKQLDADDGLKNISLTKQFGLFKQSEEVTIECGNEKFDFILVDKDELNNLYEDLNKKKCSII